MFEKYDNEILRDMVLLLVVLFLIICIITFMVSTFMGRIGASERGVTSNGTQSCNRYEMITIEQDGVSCRIIEHTSCVGVVTFEIVDCDE